MDQTAGIWSHCLDVAALSDIGLRRANNQDSYTVVLAGSEDDFRQRGHVLMVADGMGGHAAGELASKMATDIVSLDYRKLLDQTPAEAILSAVLDANHQIHVRGQASPEFRGMGTTSTILVLLPGGALVAHVGDSRCYRVRGQRIEQLTFDHSYVWEMQAAGQMPEGGIPGFISKSSITRSLGPHATEQVDLEGPHAVQAGDTFVLCSDGLSNQVKDEEIGLVLNCLPPAEAVHALIELACLRGGPDNITAVVARVLGPQVPETADAAPSQRSDRSNVRPVDPKLWTLLGVASLATLGLAALQQWWLFVVGLTVAAAALVTVLVKRYGGGSKPESDHRHFGRGPYVAVDCTAKAEHLAVFADIVRQLRDAATEEQWSVDYRAVDQHLTQAATATKGGNLTAAASGYLRAIIVLMAQLREQRSASSDSSVFL
ncbi:MAG: protein phosphatase 2C domain-containing protein [Thermoguttaceae bacterium]